MKSGQRYLYDYPNCQIIVELRNNTHTGIVIGFGNVELPHSHSWNDSAKGRPQYISDAIYWKLLKGQEKPG
jgi:hypothetical protein